MKKLGILIIFLLIVVGALFAWWTSGQQPVNKADTSTTIFLVPKGAGIRAIANDLKEQNLIKDPVVFFLVVKQLGLDNKIQAGDFRLSPSMSAAQIAKELTTGTLDLWVTVPEGKRADEIADILKATLPTYEESWRSTLRLHEGYLFPDTYLIPKDADINMIVSQMRNNFNTKFATITKDNPNDLSDEEIVIVASMLEREARHAEDFPMVSSVIHNRLDISMKLDIDATVQYAIGTPKKWWPQLTDSAKNIEPNSPYNTYTHPGLPPGPISNPGITALKAAAAPAESDYLFYIADKNGINRYAKDLEGHNNNIEKYGL